MKKNIIKLSLCIVLLIMIFRGTIVYAAGNWTSEVFTTTCNWGSITYNNSV